MLQTLRERPIVKRVILSAVVVVMFLGIGIGVTSVLSDLLRGRTSSATSSGPWALQVGSEMIDPLAFQEELRSVSRELEAQGLNQMPNFQTLVVEQAMRRLQRRAIETQEARRAGLKVTDEEVSDRITSMPDLQRDGRFVGPEEYKRILARNELNVGRFEQRIRDSLLMERWEALVGAAAIVSESEVDEELAHRNQKVRYDFVLVDPSKQAPAPTEVEIKAFYEAHPDRYQLGESRRGRYLLVEVKGDDSQVPAPTEDELKKAYEADHASFPGTFEQARDAVRRQLVFQRSQVETDRRAAVLRATITDAASLDAAAAKAGLQVQDTGLLRRDTEEASAIGPAFVEALFKAPVGSVEGPVHTLKGSAVFVVTDAKPTHHATLEEARKDIVADFSKEKGRDAALAAAKRAVDSAGGDLGKIAQALGSTVQNGPLVSKGEPVPPLGYDPAVERTAFATEPGTIAAPIATSGGSVVVLKLVEKVAPDPGTLAASRQKVRDELLAAREQALVNSILEAANRRTETKKNDDFFKQFGS